MLEKTITVTEAARNFSDLVNRTYYLHESILLLKNGDPVARIVPAYPSNCSARDLAQQWESLPHLSTEEAEAFESDLAFIQQTLKTPTPPWE